MLSATREVGEQGVLLEHEAGAAVLGLDAADAVVDELAADADLAARRRRQAGGQAQQRRLAAPARPDEGDELVLGDGEVDAGDRVDGAERLARRRGRRGRRSLTGAAGGRRRPVEVPAEQGDGDEGDGDDRQGWQGGLLEARLRRQVVHPHRQRVEADRPQQVGDRQLLEGVDADEDRRGQHARAGQRQVDPAHAPTAAARRATGPTPSSPSAPARCPTRRPSCPGARKRIE